MTNVEKLFEDNFVEEAEEGGVKFLRELAAAITKDIVEKFGLEVR